MIPIFNSVLLTVAAAGLVGALSPSADQLLDQYGLPHNATGATVFSLIYATPLYSFARSFSGAVGLAELGTNNFRSSGALATPSSTSVVHPNVDTLYAIAVTDLAESDLVFHLPAMEPDRTYIVGFWDPFDGQYASIGSITGSKPGDYLIQPTLNTGKHGLATCEGYESCINSPTIAGTLLIRVEVKNNGTDLDYVKGWIAQASVETVKNHTAEYEPLSPSTFTGLANDTYTQTLQLAARLTGSNPPWNPNYTSPVTEILDLAGIRNGSYHPQPSVNADMTSSEYQEVLKSDRQNILVNATNGWVNVNPAIAGKYHDGTAFLPRASLAVSGYLLNSANLALYPSPVVSTFRVSSNQSILFDFSGKPPVGDDGFWSLTAYNSAGYLIANSQNKYAVGDRSNITYPDGSLVYPDPLNTTFNSSSTNAPFQILVQSDAVPPPSNWTNNWLPAPSDNSNFTITFRLYAPTKALLDKSYAYPLISTHAAIT